MTDSRPFNALHERYASREMAAVFSARNRYRTWRRLWVTLASCQRALGLPITGDQIEALERAVDDIDFERVAEIERATRHDVVAHIRHYAEQVGDAGGIIHLGATSAFVTDNTDVLLQRQALQLVSGRVVTVLAGLAAFAREHRAVPCLAYTHFQPAQLTTVGKRAVLWAQDFLLDRFELEHRIRSLRCRGVKGTTGTQASYLTLFDGDHEKVRALDRMFAEELGLAGSFPVTGQTYSRKQDSQVLAALSGLGESAHKLGTDLRLLQGVGELSEPFDDSQVGSSAMAYKRNPVRAERMCGLARRLWTDQLAGPLNTGTQWLERSLDDSSNRRLVLTDAFLTADAVASLAGHIASGLRVKGHAVAARVSRELPFMATETFLMAGVLAGGDRQLLHERIRELSLEAQRRLERGEEADLVQAIVDDPAFGLTRDRASELLDPVAFTGRSAQQVDEFLAEHVDPVVVGADAVTTDAPRV